MENNNFDNSLEEFLQKETSQHRMYPSDHIWRNIHKALFIVNVVAWNCS